MKSSCLSQFVLLVSTLSAHTLGAQQAAPLHFTIAANVATHSLQNIGNPKPILEGLLTLRTFKTKSVGVVASIVGGRTFTPPMPSGDDMNCPIDRDGGCKPGLPEFSYGGVQLGGEARFRQFTFSLMSGPAAFHTKSMRKVGGVSLDGRRLFPTIPASTVLSIHTRAEATWHFGKHFGWVVSSTWRHLPQYRGAPFDVNGIGTGIRLQ